MLHPSLGGYYLPTSPGVTVTDFNSSLSTLIPNMTSAGRNTQALYLDPVSQESIRERTTTHCRCAI